MDVFLSHITKRYGRILANDGVTVALKPGRIHGLLGENGAGKSTLMRVLAGHVMCDDGFLEVDGVRHAGLTPGAAMGLGIGMLSQDPLDFPPLAAWENFTLGGRPRTRKQARDRLAELSESLGFTLRPDDPVERFTVAERQQLELARLMDADVRLLILDEPTTGISPEQKDILFRILRDFAANKGRIVILVTHKLPEAEELCHEVLVMRRGRLVGSFEPPYDAGILLETMFGPEAAKAATEPEITGQAAMAAIRVREAAAPHKAQAPALAELADVAFSDEKSALPPVSLALRPGEVVGVAGVAGGGQELFLRGLAGLARIRSGRYGLGGADMRGRTMAAFSRAGVHFLPASRMEEGLFPGLSLADHARLGFPDEKGDIRDLFSRRFVDRFHVPDQPGAPAASLSGGNQQRLLLSLIPDNTRLLVAESPTRGLDVASCAQVWEHLHALAAQGTAVVFSSEDLDEILARSGRILVFYNRRLAADTPAAGQTVRGLGRHMTGRVGQTAAQALSDAKP
ncbi:ATP-binding cassette domain-containing protein [Desulfovibrio sulfodismutans]|uniref:ATP-binding cassette domain-containing protein n=1 Tax=Desulfolutivibrio sulfodismutans TaxID=63561 RepID=A0A7K3NIT8_9BACT|nr:ATP-binding cassette domain-containing protein [Desulfolutivibrio sulfodismutans]NDY56070.1 ATP-binding cassette domain-containing protein [Desulfolutivibrio sulfodismutans]QLA12325.1 ATP-binding cassette domain-containing protein [Desulfolutivibrio sulfodismutans DSM 3696]